MPLLWVVVGVALMLVLMLVVKLDAFIALLITSLAVAVLNGMSLLDALQSILKGIGNTMGGVALMLVFGAMLGRLLDESGAAQAIATRLHRHHRAKAHPVRHGDDGIPRRHRDALQRGIPRADPARVHGGAHDGAPARVRRAAARVGAVA